MDFRRQRYFLAVAQNLGFRKAAEILNISQPALSQQIRALEEDLGVVLFDRTGRMVSLTPAGEEYYRGVEAMLSEMQHWVRRTRDAHAGQQNVLTLGVNTVMVVSRLPPIVNAFREAHPEVQLNISVTPPPDIFRQLADRHIDLALTGYAMSDEEIGAEPLWHFPIKVALSASHPLAGKDVVDLHDLAGETLLVPARPSELMSYNKAEELNRALGIVPFRIHEVVGDKPSFTIMGLVSCSLGFALLSSAYEDVMPSRIVFRPVLQPFGAATISACFRQADQNPLIEKFMVLARQFAIAGNEPKGVEARGLKEPIGG